jgi:hypothetical protein
MFNPTIYINTVFLTSLLFFKQQTVSATLCKFLPNSTEAPIGSNLICHDFSSWSELNSYASFQNVSVNVSTFNLEPNKPILLTQELNILSQDKISSGNLAVYGVKGINVYPWPAAHNAQARNGLSLFLSIIEFYVNEESPSEYECSRDLLPNFRANSSSIFTSVFSSMYISQFNNYHSEAPVCPYLFKNAQTSSIFMYGQVDSFLFKQLLRFNQDYSNDTKLIGSNISDLDITGFNYKVDTGLLHPLVFSKMTFLSLTNSASIQTDLFKNFQHLKELYLILDSVGNFFHLVGIAWMSSLVSNVSVSFSSKLIYGNPSVSVNYSYPDRDLCLFASFSQNRSTYIKPNGIYSLSYCTNTLKWLGRNYYNKPSSVYSVCSSDNQCLNDTEIDKKLKLCELINLTHASGYPTYPDYYQAKLTIMFITNLIPFVCIPCACFCGLFLNWKIIQTVKNNKKKELKEDFYKYMSANAKFNCLYCLIFVFYPMTSCSWRPSYLFCSSVFTTQFAQYYKIAMIAYFGEVLKMSANISYLMMTLNRYLLIGKGHAAWLVSIAKMEFKWVIRSSILVSALMNLGHIWEYDPIEDWVFSPLMYGVNSGYETQKYESYTDYPIPNFGQAFFYYTIVYFLINSIVFFAVNTTIEVRIIYRLREEIEEKRKRMAQMSARASFSSITNGSTDHIDVKKSEEDEKKERRVIKMVFFNGFFNFLLRFSDVLVLFENENIWKSFAAYLASKLPGFMNLFVDIGYFTYILTFSTNFLIFYKFNSKFREAVVFFSGCGKGLAPKT